LAKCAGIKRDGGRCRGIAIDGSDYCYAHDPDRAEERKRAAAKGGRRGGRGRPASELSEIKQGVRDLIAGVLSDDAEERVDRGRAAVALQGYNTLLRAVEIGQRGDLEDLARDVEELKRGYRTQRSSA
jgi:hypothetical protein